MSAYNEALELTAQELTFERDYKVSVADLKNAMLRDRDLAQRVARLRRQLEQAPLFNRSIATGLTKGV